jgi:plasmid maintenance system antidote protein VapI
MRLRVLLGKADLSEQAAATVLELDEAEIRAYIAAERPVPRYVILALERIVDMRGMAAERWPVNGPGE